MKRTQKVISMILAVLMLFSMCTVSAAADTKEIKESDIVFIPMSQGGPWGTR